MAHRRADRSRDRAQGPRPWVALAQEKADDLQDRAEEEEADADHDASARSLIHQSLVGCGERLTRRAHRLASASARLICDSVIRGIRSDRLTAYQSPALVR